MKYFAVPPNEAWRTGFLSELLENEFEIPGLNNDEIEEMVSYLVLDYLLVVSTFSSWVPTHSSSIPHTIRAIPYCIVKRT